MLSYPKLLNEVRSRHKQKEEQIRAKLAARAANFKEWRTLNGLSLVGIGRAVGAHWNSVARWEKNGKIPNWALVKLQELGFNG